MYILLYTVYYIENVQVQVQQVTLNNVIVVERLVL